MRRAVLGVSIVALFASLILSPTPAAAATTQTLPDSDPFYAVPANVASFAPGTVLGSRTVQVGATSGVVGAFTASQVLYRTVDNQGLPTATVATVLKPLLPWLGHGPRPLLSYQAAEDGLDTSCSPSYLMTNGDYNFALEATNVTTALTQGWTVVVSDYEGPRSQFLGATGEPREVLDGVRAAIAFSGSGVTSTSPVGLWGQSGGAFATALAAQIQSTYAPELNVQAVVTGALPAELNDAFAILAGNSTAPLIPLLIAGIEKSYPEAHLEQYLTPAIQQRIDDVSSLCFQPAQGNESAVASLASIEAYPGSVTAGPFRDLVHSLSPLGAGGLPTAPVYDYHGLIDQIAPLAPDRTLMRQYCAAGVRVTHVELPAEHTTSMVTGAPGAILFLSTRFAGIQVPMNCAVIPAS